MAPSDPQLESIVSWQGMLGYLNFSEGKPDPRFQKQLNDAYAFLVARGLGEPWHELYDLLVSRLSSLKESGAAAFQETTQAEAVLALTFGRLLPAYRQHHADLLVHQADRDLFQPFFLARVIESVLAQGSPWNEHDRIVKNALNRLNDFVGHRPIAILETRPRGEPYEQERVRPIPLYLKGAGVASGRYHDLLEAAMKILEGVEPPLRAEAHLDLELLEEMALDPRAYDFGHPVHRRPNYVFGEWDPHHLDNNGRFRRFVLRQVTLDALLQYGWEGEARAEPARQEPRPPAPVNAERLFEAAAVLAGTILMATGLSGSGPEAHDSSVTLATLTPQIARYRDAYYQGLLQSPLVSDSQRARLQQEAKDARQPFAAARQHLNQCLARARAVQLQQRHLSILFADMGFADASRREAARIPVASVRILSEILGRVRSAHRLLDQHDPAAAAPLLPEAEDLLQRGIGCGALADPWNILGFQALFPLFTSREDAVRDTRIDELLLLMEQLFNLYARLMSESAAAGQKGLVESLRAGLERLAGWWDRFASHEVSDVRRVHGAEAAASAEHVANCLARWHERGEATADLAFWKDLLEGFRSPKSFAIVVEALLRKEDYRASMALLMNWLGQADQVPLEAGEFSFNGLALRWMLGLTRPADSTQAGSLGAGTGRQAAGLGETQQDPWPLVKKFFDYLEANAEDYMQVPELEGAEEDQVKDEEEEVYGAAYENVTFRESSGDDEGGGLVDDAPADEFELEETGELLMQRLRFSSTAARLMVIAARATAASTAPDRIENLTGWLEAVEEARPDLLALLEGIQQFPVPEPTGTFESNVEYDRRRRLKERLLYAAIDTALDFTLAGGALRSACGAAAKATAKDRPAWEAAGARLERALFHADGGAVRAALPEFLEHFGKEPLLFISLADGGDPRHILRARIAQGILRVLAINLPRLGLLRETLQLLRTARAMEDEHKLPGRGTSEFNFLFQAAFQGVVETVVHSTSTWEPERADDRRLAELLETVTGPFLDLWREHSRTLTLSLLETIHRGQRRHWEALVQFVRRYGRDLFHAQFLTLGNLRGILHRGAGEYLDHLQANPDPLHPVRLIEELDQKIPRKQAAGFLQMVLQLVADNYEEYNDYKITCTQSDYGENLYLLLDFLWLKASYERHAWQFRPLVWVHEVLSRGGRPAAARLWEEAFANQTKKLADRHLQQLAQMEQGHGIRLRTIADRLGERFVKPMQIDRLSAWVRPALAEAPREDGAFAGLLKELAVHAATPTGIGLDVPVWLRRIEEEVHRVRAEGTELVALVEKHFRIPKAALTHEELQEQLKEWEKKPG